MEVNIYYQRHGEKTKIDIIRGQKSSVILEMLWLAHHNPEINWRIGVSESKIVDFIYFHFHFHFILFFELRIRY